MKLLFFMLTLLLGSEAVCISASVKPMHNQRQSIFLLTERARWDEAKIKGFYTDKTIKEVGFIHASSADEIIAVANTFYHNKKDLVLIQIDPKKCISPIKYEGPHPNLKIFQGKLFPHIYGPLNVDAAIKAVDVSENRHGQFDMISLKLNAFQ